METLKSRLEAYRPPVKSKITNERQLIIKEFLDRLNSDRGGRPPLAPGFVGMKMRYMTTSQLKQFLGDCKYAKNFSSYWWWALNPKNFQ